jgi:hypothetical protein
MAIRRSLVVGVFGAMGILCAFFVGARAGATLNGHVNAISVAKVPMLSLQAAVVAAEVPTPVAVARK